MRHVFSIADLSISITFNDTRRNSIKLLPAFHSFIKEDKCDDLLFSLTVDDTLKCRTNGTLIKNVDTGNGRTLVYRMPDKGYQYIIRDINGRDCCLLQTDKNFNDCHCALNGTWNMRTFGLNNALMLIFAFAGSYHDLLLIHASCVRHKDMAYPFIAKSGTGKSTHSNLWMQHIQGTDLINDDNPIVRVISGKPYIYGSPWSGKTPCYRNMRVPLGAITRIERASHNCIEKQGPVKAFASLLPACSSMKWDSTIYNNICNTTTRLIETVPVYTLYCLPNEEAAVLCHNNIVR